MPPCSMTEHYHMNKAETRLTNHGSPTQFASGRQRSRRGGLTQPPSLCTLPQLGGWAARRKVETGTAKTYSH
eukprot:5538975-Amphidinium_carterae.1